MTIDALGRRHHIAARIIAKKADYPRAPKGNQGGATTGGPALLPHLQTVEDDGRQV